MKVACKVIVELADGVDEISDEVENNLMEHLERCADEFDGDGYIKPDSSLITVSEVEDSDLI
jgi:hypothetical protein